MIWKAWFAESLVRGVLGSFGYPRWASDILPLAHVAK
jgi:hypothetical protein